MERRKDHKGKVLRDGESQRANLTYMYRYRDLNNERKCVYAKTLEELRKKEKEISKNIEKQIEEKFMLDAYQLLKDNQISLGELETMICGKQKKTA